MKKRILQRPGPFGYPSYPAFDFYIGFNTVQIHALRPNNVVYEKDFEKFKKWIDAVKKYAAQQNGNNK